MLVGHIVESIVVLTVEFLFLYFICPFNTPPPRTYPEFWADIRNMSNIYARFCQKVSCEKHVYSKLRKTFQILEYLLEIIVKLNLCTP